MYLPHGFAHAVINMGCSGDIIPGVSQPGPAMTVAVTHNFVSQENARATFEWMQEERPELARNWSDLLLRERPHIHNLLIDDKMLLN